MGLETALAAVAIASTAISTGASIYGGMQQAKESRRAAEAQQRYEVEQAEADVAYEAELQRLERDRQIEQYNLEHERAVREYQVNEYNARLQEQQAKSLDIEAERESFASRIKAQDDDFDAAQIYANILAQQASSGTVIGLGSNTGMLESTKRRQELNRLRTLEQGAYNYASLKAQAQATRRGAALTRNAPVDRPRTIIDTPAPPRRAAIPLQPTTRYTALDGLSTVAGGVATLSANRHVEALVLNS